VRGRRFVISLVWKADEGAGVNAVDVCDHIEIIRDLAVNTVSPSQLAWAVAGLAIGVCENNNSLAAGEGLQIQSEAASTVSRTGAFVFML